MSWMNRLFLIGVLGIPLLSQDATLEHARHVNLERAAKIPDFVAHELVTDYVDRKGSGEWKLNYTVEDEITVKGNQIRRRDFYRNGKPLNLAGRFRRGSPPTGPAVPTGFGAALQALFDPNCPTTLEYAGKDELHGKTVLAYQFHSPANGCFGNLYFSHGSTYNAARTGRVLIDGSSGNVIQFDEDAFGFPEPYFLITRHQVMTWDYVRIGDAAYWLPISAEFNWTYKAPYRRREVVVYRNHRHFESATDIQYQ
jgi:hypothetical protein